MVWLRSAAAGLVLLAASGIARSEEASPKEAFEAAKELGTEEAWSVFIKNYPKGFHTDLARAYLKKLKEGAAPGEAEAPQPEPSEPAAESPEAETPVGKPPASRKSAKEAPAQEPPAQEAPAEEPAPEEPAAAEAPTAEEPAPSKKPVARPASKAGAGAGTAAKPASGGGDIGPTDPAKPAIARGGSFMGFPERFNRYYTDPAWQPARTIFVSPKGGGDGSSRDKPATVTAGIASAKPGTRVTFTRGAYKGCYGLSKEQSGSYDAPVVLQGERNDDGSLGVSVTCCTSERRSCFNLEQADYVAIDGFEMIGGAYGVRAVGAGYPASEHSRGIAVIDCKGRDQDKDPFFSGQSDWAVWEGLTGSGAKKEDGHGLYISNGSDWNIVRYVETWGGDSSDFQINADPTAACVEADVKLSDPRCHAYAGTGEGGQGASDYMLIDSNHFHHSLGPGANFASVRRSLVRNNVFGPHGSRHNTSFYSEVDEPKLGSSDNRIVHNLFITTERHGVKFENNSTRNLFANNIVVGVKISGGKAAANPQALLMEVDAAASGNEYRGNVYLSGTYEGRKPNAEEKARPDFSAAWFRKFPVALAHDANDLTPTAKAPFLGLGVPLPEGAADRNGTPREGRVDPGPIQGE